jgi:hypothetical protein
MSQQQLRWDVEGPFCMALLLASRQTELQDERQGTHISNAPGQNLETNISSAFEDARRG